MPEHRIPHPFPYQGSKRGIAEHILSCFPSDVRCLIEPFCGSGAVSIAAAFHGMAQAFHLNDLNKPLTSLWNEILKNPAALSDAYRELWRAQQHDKKNFFIKVRDEFNHTPKSGHMLYLLARIVKGSVRYNTQGAFNQSADNRRLGMHPDTMRKQLLGVSTLLAGRTNISSADFRQVASLADTKDLVYMDPPYQGTSSARDRRYYAGLGYDEFASALQTLNQKSISYIVSYDGQRGDCNYGKTLPKDLALKHLHICAGRSSQSTLLGKSDTTVESLYLSPALVERLHENTGERAAHRTLELRQERLFS